MAKSPMEVVKALLSKTIENGCTPSEEESSVAMALAWIKRHGLKMSNVRFPIRYDEFGNRLPEGQVRKEEKPRVVFPDIDRSLVEEILRRARAAAAAKHYSDQQAKASKTADEARAQRERQQRQDERRGKRSYRTVQDLCEEMLSDPFTTFTYSEVIRRVKQYFPDAKTGINSLRWYETQLRKRGVKLPRRKH